MKVGQLLADQLEKLGVDTTDDSLKNVLGVSVDIPDEIATKIQSGFFTEESGKSNPALKNHFLDPFIKGNDRNLKDYLDSEKISEEKIKEVFSFKTQKERMAAALSAVKEKSLADLENFKKQQLDEAGKSQKLDQKIIDENKSLYAKINQLESSTVPKAEYEKLINDFRQKRIDDKINSTFSSQNWSQNFVPELRTNLAKVSFEAELNQLQGIIVEDEQGTRIVRKDNPEMPLYDTAGKPVTIDSLVKSVMTKYKFEAVSAPANPSAKNTFVPAANGGATPTKLTPAQLQLRKAQADQEANLGA